MASFRMGIRARERQNFNHFTVSCSWANVDGYYSHPDPAKWLNFFGVGCTLALGRDRVELLRAFQQRPWGPNLTAHYIARAFPRTSQAASACFPHPLLSSAWPLQSRPLWRQEQVYWSLVPRSLIAGKSTNFTATRIQHPLRQTRPFPGSS